MLEPGEAPLLDRLIEEIVAPVKAGSDDGRSLLLMGGTKSRRPRAIGARDLAGELAEWWEATSEGEDPEAEIRSRAEEAELTTEAVAAEDGTVLGWIVSPRPADDRTRVLLVRVLELSRWIAGERRHLAAMVEARTAEIERTRHELQGVDPETGLANRRDFDRAFDREWRRAARLRRPLAVVLVEVGGAVTRPLAGRIASIPSRATDIVARFEPRRLAILLPDTDSNDAEILGRRLLGAMEGEKVHLGIGGVTPRVGFLDSWELIKIAREALEIALKGPVGGLEVRSIDDVAAMTGRRSGSSDGKVN